MFDSCKLTFTLFVVSSFLPFLLRIGLRKRFFFSFFARCFLYPYKMIKIQEGNWFYFIILFFFSEITPSSFMSFCTNTGVIFKYSARWSNSVASNYLRIFKFYGGINNEAVVARVNPATIETRSDRFSINKILRCHQLAYIAMMRNSFHSRYLFVISS